MFDPEVVDPVVAFLVELAGDGSALELGIGTGRIALPLARRGIRVHGIDLSEAMVARLRVKPGAEQIGVTTGDFATTTVDGRFSVAYLVFNTIMNLTSQEEQILCFQNVAAHLQPGGCFVVEVAVPDLQRLPPGDTVRAFTVSDTRLGFDEYNIASQGLISHHYWDVDGKLEGTSLPFRYVAGRTRPDGAACGMSPRECWSDWKREPFTSDSRAHVSVWQKPAGFRLTERALGRPRSGARAAGRRRASGRIEGMLPGPLGHHDPFIVGHGDRPIECGGDRGGGADRDDHRGVPDSLADSASAGGDHWTAAGQHLLHERDPECLNKLWPRLAWQYESGAACHQMGLLVVVDIIKEPDPVRCR
jgi:SAM-dependent methyltransferase